MNSTSRAIFQTVLASDPTLSVSERAAVQRIINGETDFPQQEGTAIAAKLLVTQKKAADLLSVSRVTVWRMTKDLELHPVELRPGMWRYPFGELAALAQPLASSITSDLNSSRVAAA